MLEPVGVFCEELKNNAVSYQYICAESVFKGGHHYGTELFILSVKNITTGT